MTNISNCDTIRYEKEMIYMNINNQLQMIKIIELEKCYSNDGVELEKYITKQALRLNRVISMFYKALSTKDIDKAKKIYKHISEFDNRIIDGKIKSEIHERLKMYSLLKRYEIIGK